MIDAFIRNLTIDSKQITIDESHWRVLVHTYVNSNRPQQDYLLNEIHRFTSIAVPEIETLLSSLTQSTEIEIDENRKKFNVRLTSLLPPKVEHFKQRANRLLPRLNRLSLTDKEWLVLTCQFQYQQRKNLSRVHFLHQVIQLRKTDFSLLRRQLSREQPLRKTKRTTEHAPLPLTNRKRKRSDGSGPNFFIMDPGIACPSPLKKLLTETGVRQCLLTPASPVKGYSKVSKTPEKGTRVRRQYSGCGVEFFTPLTPVKNQHDTSKSNRFEIRKRLPRLHYDRPNEVFFTATQATIEACHGKKRYLSQKQLTGASCKDVFIAHGDAFAVKMSGNKFHWSHLIAHFLGGQQSKENLIPATAASNYNTLEMVEQFIAEKLASGMCHSIDIKATPMWTNEESLIPDELVFNLRWQEINSQDKSINKEEFIHINPRSHQRITASMHKSMACLRSFEGCEQENRIAI